MTSYLSTLLTNTSSRYANLRQTLLPGASETDGDTEDDSHICRVLRAYYVEKKRPFPEWLPPDPRQKRVDPQQAAGGYMGTYGSQNGAMSHAQYSGAGAGWNGAPTGTHAASGVYRPAGGQGTGRRAGGLSDLWNDSPSGPPAQQAGNSLRAGSRQASGQALYTSNTGRQHEPTPAAFTTNQPAYGSSHGTGPAAGRTDRFNSGGPQTARLTPGGARPLPSQREGSYQSLRRDASGSSTSSGAYGANPYDQPQRTQSPALPGGQTAQDRLKAKLWGGAGRGGPAR